MINSNFYKKYLIGTLIITILFSSFFFFTAKRAEAVWGGADIVIEVGPNLVENTLTTVSVTSTWFKEYVLDPIAWIVAKTILRSITDSLVDWINSGFEGNPTFVDPDTFLRDVADQASGAFIQQLGLEGILCSPFRLPILASLNLSYKKSTLPRFQCTLSAAKENWQRNWDEFMYDFTNGGWDRWLNVTTQQQNNPYGAYLMAYDEMQSRRAIAQEKKKTEVSWGSGFASLQECSGDIDQEKMCDTQCGHLEDSDDCFNSCMEIEGWDENLSSAEKCKLSGEQMKNTTPGKIIEGRLSKALGMDLESLSVADEISEIIAALINQLMMSLKGGTGKLTGGSTYSSTGGEPTSYTKEGAIAIIDHALTYEKSYRDANKKSVDAYNDAIAKIELLKKCYEDQIVLLRQQGRNTEADALQVIIDTQLIPMRTNLENMKKPFESAVQSSNYLISQLEAVKSTIQSSTTYQEMSDLVEKFQGELQPQLHGAEDAINANLEYEETVEPYLNDILNGSGGINSLYQQCLAGLSI